MIEKNITGQIHSYYMFHLFFIQSVNYKSRGYYLFHLFFHMYHIFSYSHAYISNTLADYPFVLYYKGSKAFPGLASTVCLSSRSSGYVAHKFGE